MEPPSLVIAFTTAGTRTHAHRLMNLGPVANMLMIVSFEGELPLRF
jgi:hypothetical protein